MKKTYKNINNINFNKYRYNKIMESINPEIKRKINEQNNFIDDDIEEQVLNELFNFGSSSAKKPEKSLSLENSDDENAELVIQWCGYFMAQAGNNVKKGLDSFIKQFGSILIKMPKLIVKGILMLLSGTIKNVAFGITSIASIVLSLISLLVRFVNSGIENASNALTSLYTTLTRGINAFYNWFSEETINVLNSAKEKKDAAVFMVKTWLSNKSNEIKKWITSTVSDIRSTVVKAWNAMDKKARKTYDNIASKLEDWMKDISELISSVEDKISDTISAAKDFAIDKKDKALIWGIQKGVKGLSKNYTEDQLVALVRKCYNENLIPDIKGNYHINEEYFYKPNTRIRMLYENKKISHRKRLY